MKKNFIYKKYSSEYKEQVIDLLEILWNFERNKRLSYFKWKFEDNPYTDEPLAFIALDGNKVVAFRGYMVQPLVYNGKTFFNASLADTVTHQDYRRMGLFKGITHYSISEISKNDAICMSLNSSSGGPTLQGYLDLGWIPLADRNNIFRFSLRGILSYLFKEKEVSYNYNKILRNGRIVITTELKANEVIGLAYDEDMITHERSSVFYNWRLSNPIAEYIYAYNYNVKNELVAYAVLKKIGYKKFDLIDYNYKEKSALKQVLTILTNYIKPIYILWWTVNPNSILNLKSFYFKFIALDVVLSRWGKFKRPPLLVRSFINNKLSKECYSSMHWNLYKIIGDEV